MPGAAGCLPTPAKASQRSNLLQSSKAMKMKGRMLSTIQNGWVSSWNRLISRTPCVTSGITMTALMI